MSRRSKRLPAYARRHESGIVSDLECAAIICADIPHLEAEMRKLTCVEQHVGMRADVSVSLAVGFAICVRIVMTAVLASISGWTTP
jgi:hypothetical protein